MKVLARAKFLGPPMRVRDDWGGAVRVAWALDTVLFSSYVTAFGNYNQIGGTIGGATVLPVWACRNSFFFLLDVCLDAQIEE